MVARMVRTGTGRRSAPTGVEVTELPMPTSGRSQAPRRLSAARDRYRRDRAGSVGAARPHPRGMDVRRAEFRFHDGPGGGPVDTGITIHPGDAVEIEFDLDPDALKRYSGTVESISYVSSGEGNQKYYSAYISFEADKNVRLGLPAIVYLKDAENSDSENEGG